MLGPLAVVLSYQAIEDEGGNPEEITIAPEAATKKSTPKRTAKGNNSRIIY